MRETVAAAAIPTPAEQRLIVQRILGSELFSKSHRLSAFLRFIFEQYSDGHADRINEQRIGTTVFGRPPGYHVGDDSIVRSQARFLRLRLEEYFSHEGSQEPFVLVIPKGSYVPSFEPREVQAAVPQQAAAPQPAVDSTVVQRSSLAWRWVAGVSTIVAVVFAALFLGSRQRVHPGSSGPPAVQRFWSSIFNPERTTVLVPADSTFVLIQEMSGKTIRLPAYIDKDYGIDRTADRSASWMPLIGRQYTTMADLDLVARLEQLPEAEASRPQVRFAREVTLKELKEFNAILIGGLRSNPWLELFSPAVHFDVDYDNATGRNVVRNRLPGANELTTYIEDNTGARTPSVSYGVIAYVPSLDNQGRTLTVEGTSQTGTEAAAEFLSSPAFGAFLSHIGATASAVPYFELLISTRSMDGSSYHPAVTAWHILHPPNSN